MKCICCGKSIPFPEFGIGVEFLFCGNGERSINYGMSYGELDGERLKISFGGVCVSTTSWRTVIGQRIYGTGWKKEFENWGRSHG